MVGNVPVAWLPPAFYARNSGTSNVMGHLTKFKCKILYAIFIIFLHDNEVHGGY
jgi:hypothetical protein